MWSDDPVFSKTLPLFYLQQQRICRPFKQSRTHFWTTSKQQFFVETSNCSSNQSCKQANAQVLQNTQISSISHRKPLKEVGKTSSLVIICTAEDSQPRHFQYHIHAHNITVFVNLKDPEKNSIYLPYTKAWVMWRIWRGKQAISMLEAFLLRLKRQIWSDFMCAPVANFIYTRAEESGSLHRQITLFHLPIFNPCRFEARAFSTKQSKDL